MAWLIGCLVTLVSTLKLPTKFFSGLKTQILYAMFPNKFRFLLVNFRNLTFFNIMCTYHIIGSLTLFIVYTLNIEFNISCFDHGLNAYSVKKR